MEHGADGSRIPLAELVGAVRAELQAAAVQARGQELQFEVQGLQLEVDVAVEGAREGEGGLNVWVFTIGGKRTRTDTATHRVTLNLSAVNRAGNRFTVSDLSEQLTRRT